MSASRLLVLTVVWVGVLFASPLWAQVVPTQGNVTEPPRLNDAAELAKVVSLYEAGKYAQCADALHRLLSPDSSRPLHVPDVVENARVYHAACLIGNGQNAAADEPLRAAIRQNPQMKPPDSLVFPPQVIERFLSVRETMFDVIRNAEDERVRRAQQQAAEQERRARQERQRVLGLERLAQQETVIIPKSRWLALVPFGVGQFQNDEKTLGYVFLSTELALAASTLTTLGVETHIVLARGRVDKADPSVTSTLKDWKTALVFSSYAWLGVTMLGVIEAQLSFVPERRQLRHRPLPPELRPQVSSLRVVPSAGPVPGGLVVGLAGQF